MRKFEVKRFDHEYLIAMENLNIQSNDALLEKRERGRERGGKKG